MTSICVVLSGGGTGGHLVPGLNLAGQLLAQGDKVSLVCSGGMVEWAFLSPVSLASRYPGLELHQQDLGGSRIGMPFSMARNIAKSRRLLKRLEADIVVGLGGRASLPCLLAARLQGLPFVLLEQNAVPGRANLLAARFARRVYAAFPDTRRAFSTRLEKDGVLVESGMPLRKNLPAPRNPELLSATGVPDGALLVLVVGGSQGAMDLNRLLPRLFATLDPDLKEKLFVLHLSGVGKEPECSALYRYHGLRAKVLPFIEELAPYYAIADLVVCRGGGTTLFELAAAGKAALVLPYPWHKDRQQYHNAEYFERRGAFRILDQEDLRHEELEASPAFVLLDRLCRDQALREDMGRRARAAIHKDAREKIAQDLHHIVLDRHVGKRSPTREAFAADVAGRLR